MIEHRPPEPRGPRIAALILALAAAGPVAAEGPTKAELHLANGGTAAGTLRESDRPGVVRWLADPFVDPFEFHVPALNAIHWPPPAAVPKAKGDYCVELAGGDVVFGTLLGLDESSLEFESPRLGRFRIDRAEVRRIDRWRDGADLIYLGPNGLNGWRDPSGGKNWREEAGQLTTQAEGVELRGDLGLPARAAIEFEISWKTRPDFILAFGVGANDQEDRHAFRFEVWGEDLVVYRETDQLAGLAPIARVADGPGQVHLRAFLDQERGRILVATPEGKLLADVDVPLPKWGPFPGVLLFNNHGEIHLERLRIGRWDGEVPRNSASGKPRVALADGSSIKGRVTGFDAAAREFLVADGDDPSRIEADRVASIDFGPASDRGSRSVRVVYQDGVRLGGQLLQVESDAIRLKVPGVAEPIRLPIDGLRSVIALQARSAGGNESDMLRIESRGPREGRLVVEGANLLGMLADGKEQAGSSCLAWRPTGSATAAALRRGVSGRIIRQEPPAAPPGTRREPGGRLIRPVPPAAPVAIIQRRLTEINTVRAPTPVGSPRRAIHLRTGDIIPAEITAIDEEGVTFRSPVAEGKFVPHARIKAVELNTLTAPTLKLNKAKRERLLTLPRMQKDSPPTHMIRSRTGDYLRGRLLAMDGKTLKLEVRLETKEIPRDRVARIIWLHPDELAPEKAVAPPEEAAGTRVQALRHDGTRLTFVADRVSFETISGKSDVLGPVRVRLAEADQVLIGRAIEDEAAQLAYQKWVLHHAPEPKAASAADSPSAGTESPLVGKPAPDFELDLLGGKKFHLANAKGKVVVLDFWATWCGPCMQSMPTVEAVAGEFRDRGVELVAVNLQEEPAAIKATLERHKLKPTVALDRDGVVAARYAANAIPQTVIIDRDGNVSRLYIGGGPKLGDQLREAIKGLLPADDPDAEPK